MTDVRRAVGRRLREVREKLGWTRPELAERLGVHSGSIARWETGGAIPHPYQMERIAEFGGTTADWLRTGGDDATAATGPRHDSFAVGDTSGEDVFASFEATARFLGGIGAPGEERARKLDALEGLRRMLTARGLLPGWWYDLREKVERGAV
jgi:transcriptional regulator with XRE-family HTH domain